MMNKKGITMSSIIIYVTIFFIFTAFVISISANMNYKSLSDKGEVYVNEQFEKLQYNMVTSSKASDNVSNILNRIVFSNEDEYSYDSDKKTISKNGGVLIKNVEDFKIIGINELSNVPTDFVTNIDNMSKYIGVQVKLKKYGKEITKEIFLTVGDGMNDEQ